MSFTSTLAVLWKQFWSKILSNELLSGDTYLDAHSNIKLSLKAKIFVKNLQLQVVVLKVFFWDIWEILENMPLIGCTLDIFLGSILYYFVGLKMCLNLVC